MTRGKEHDPVPKGFSIIYESGNLTRVAQDVIREKGALGVRIGLSLTDLDTTLLRKEATTLTFDKTSTTIKSTMSIGDIRKNPSHGYFSTEQVRLIRDKLWARNVDSDEIAIQRGKTILYLPRKSDEHVYAQIDLGYPSLDALITHLKGGEFGRIRLNEEERHRRRAVFSPDGDWKNDEISMQLKMKNRWILSQHAGSRIFNFYFSRYEAFIRSLYEVMGKSLPAEPILVKPLP